MAAPKLTHAFSVYVKIPVPTGMAPGNDNASLTVMNGQSGYVESADGSTRLEITCISDWMELAAHKTTATIDARMSSTGPGGLNLDMHYLGKFKLSEGSGKVFEGAPGSSFDFNDEYLYVAPRMWSRSEELKWVNDTVFLASGRAKCLESGNQVEIVYKIFKQLQQTIMICSRSPASRSIRAVVHARPRLLSRSTWRPLSSSHSPSGAKGTESHEETSKRAYDAEYDLVVVGSGCAGLTAAIVGAKKGLRVLVVEKTGFYGGTTAYSGGGAWIPCNKHQPSVGVEDTRAQAEMYLAKTVGTDAVASEKMKAFLDSGPKMVEWMEEHTAVRFKGVPLPDYHPGQPGASSGRTILTEAFDGKVLGRQIREIRYPLKGFSALGTMQADPADLGTLTAPFKSVSNFVYTTRKILRYALDLLRYGKGAEMANGNALIGRLFASSLALGVDFWRNSAAIAPVLGNGVEGLVVSRQYSSSGSTRVRARRGVVLASGGLGRSPSSQKYVPHEWTAVPRGNQGDGISIAAQAGAHTPPPNKQNAIFAPISLLHRRDGTVWRYPHFALDRAKPGSLIVGPDGRRFANESEPYQEFVGRMHAQGIKRAFFIADHAFLRKYGMGMALPWPLPIWGLLRQGYLVRGSTLAELARKIEVDAVQLQQTVGQFNEYARAGQDAEFHRGENVYDRFYGDAAVQPNPSLAPCLQGPFYALPLVPGNVSIMWGVSTNKDAQVLDAQMEPIRGLYAVGCDQNSVMRGEYPGGGSSIGPAMTFGFRAAEHVASLQSS
ncbi:FAD binding domain-containing protein [Aspergillus unguis]